MRPWSLVLILAIACGGAPVAPADSPEAPVGSDGSPILEELARAEERGVLDLVAALRGQIAERDGTAAAALAHARALDEAGAPRRARAVLETIAPEDRDEEVRLAMSSDGRWVARQTSPGAVVVHDARTGQEVGRAEASSLGGEPYLQRFRGFADTQVLGVGRFQADGGDVVRAYDRNDTAHLLDIDEGRLLATVYSERSGGWVVQTPEGAVDGPEEVRGAFVTMLRGLDTPRADAWWAAWDRFAVAGLLERVARGDRVLPPIPGYLARSVTLQAGE